MVCVETRHMQAVLKAQINKTDRNDARGIDCGDEMMRTMLYEAAQSMLRSKKWSWLKAEDVPIAVELRRADVARMNVTRPS
jgi:hypothetical protein